MATQYTKRAMLEAAGGFVLVIVATLFITFGTLLVSRPAHAANPPSLSKVCRDQSNLLGSLLSVAQAANTDTEVEEVAALFRQVVAKGEGGKQAVEIVLDALAAGTDPKFLRDKYYTACMAQVI